MHDYQVSMLIMDSVSVQVGTRPFLAFLHFTKLEK